MAPVVNEARQEFWSPPIPAHTPEAASPRPMVEVCDDCGTEFIAGARFCHTCGASRSRLPVSPISMGTGLAWFLAIGNRMGLSIGAFLAFLVGTLCVAGALTVGLIYSPRTTLDWQAVQLWRIEWLLGAIAAFVAGCLLKRTT